jgi:hypothetical protein
LAGLKDGLIESGGERLTAKGIMLVAMAGNR